MLFLLINTIDNKKQWIWHLLWMGPFAEHIIIFASAFFFPPVALTLLLVVLLATFGKSLGLREIYVNTLINIFEVSPLSLQFVAKEADMVLEVAIFFILCFRLRDHCNNPYKLPILIFPEGTCINNTSVMMFKKGSFEVIWMQISYLFCIIMCFCTIENILKFSITDVFRYFLQIYYFVIQIKILKS
uniref:PlsC domain-containing protein n=1 Tax=Heterorhabditis bacteriophora TaxID=37862 RepID=A0A1I7WHH1_HETBA